MSKKEIKVLIIEDSASDSELLIENIKKFKNRRCQATLVTHIKGAESMLAKEDFDVIFLDLNLPDCNGLETLTRINEERKNMPVVIMTGISEQKIMSDALNLGAQNFIVKGEETPASLERTIMFSIERERNIGEIKKAKRMQDEIIKNAPIMMFVVDENREVIRANPETEKFTSKKEQEMKGRLPGRYI